MPLFNVAVREHTYTGRFYGDVVQARSPEEALQVAARHAVVPGSPAGPTPQHGSGVAVPGPTPYRAAGYGRSAGLAARGAVRVAAAPGPPPGPAPQHGFSVAAAQATAPESPPGPTPQAEAAGRPRCADVWVYALLHCDLAAGHDLPHMAVARGYRRPVRWVRDDLGIAHPVPDPATGAPVVSPITQPSAAPQAEPPETPPLTGVGP